MGSDPLEGLRLAALLGLRRSPLSLSVRKGSTSAAWARHRRWPESALSGSAWACRLTSVHRP